MRSNWKTSWKILVVVAAGLWLAPQLAAASSDVEEQLQAMQDRMAQLEDKLQAQTDQLSAAEQRVSDQEKLLQDSGFSADSTGSALSRFLEMTEFGGNAAVSYNYNFNGPGSSAVGGGASNVGGTPGRAAALTAPFHPNANTFQLDQLLFSMENASTEQSPAGFRFDLAYGVSADALRGGTVANNTGSDTFLYQAYVSYLIGGVEIDVGRYETIVGAEVFQVDQNFNITRGILYGLQPTSHTGILLSGDIGGDGVSWAFGVANDISNSFADLDTDKEIMGQIAWSGETASLSTSIIFGDAGTFCPVGAASSVVGTPCRGGGGTAGTNSDDQTLLDVTATWDPSDQLSVWANFDYFFLQDIGPPNGNVWGLAVASRYAVSDATGVAVRGEVVDLSFDAGGTDQRNTLWSLTGTVDHALTDNLKAMLELRWDRLSATGSNDNFTDSISIAGSSLTRSSQLLGLVQLVYSF